MQTNTHTMTTRWWLILLALSVLPTSAVKSQAPAKPVVSLSSPLLLSTPRGPDHAPITILVFSDFESFLCARSADVLIGLLSGSRDVRLVFKHAPAASNPHSLLAHEAALAAGAQGKFWEMHDILFANQTRLARADLLAYAKALGLDVPAFQQALDRHIYRPIVERDLIEAEGLGVTTTPTFFINGRRLVGPQGPATLAGVVGSVRDGLPKNFKIHEEAVASGPAPVIRLEHAPAKGPTSAPISLVEFEDFQCLYCAESVPIIRQLLSAYPTQIRFSFKHYPLAMQNESLMPHEAALAAGDQGKFWEMHDLLFQTQSKLTRNDLIAKAAQLHLDVPRFTKDLDTHRFKPQVESDRQEGNHLGVDGTPFFFINGHAISGGADLQSFKHLIDAALKESTTPLATPVPAR